MLVFWKENLVFLSVPKTGTTAIQAALAHKSDIAFRGPPQLKHAPLYRYNRFLKPMFEKAGGLHPDTLAVIRHPAEWLSSWYRYRNRNSLIGHPNSTRGITFDDFVTEYCKVKPAAFANVGSQAAYVFGTDGKREATHLFRYEAHDKLVGYLERRLDLSINLRRMNVSPTIPAEISNDVARLLLKTHAKEFEAWEIAQA